MFEKLFGDYDLSTISYVKCFKSKVTHIKKKTIRYIHIARPGAQNTYHCNMT